MNLSERIRAILGLDSITPEKAAELDKLGGGSGSGSEATEEILRRLSASGGSDKAIEAMRDLVTKRDQEIAELRSTLSERDKALEAFQTEKAERERILEEEKKQTRTKKISDLIEAAKSDGRIPADSPEAEQRYRAILTADLENGEAILAELPKRGKPEEKPNGGKPNTGTPAPVNLSDIDAAALDAFSNT